MFKRSFDPSGTSLQLSSLQAKLTTSSSTSGSMITSNNIREQITWILTNIRILSCTGNTTETGNTVSSN